MRSPGTESSPVHAEPRPEPRPHSRAAQRGQTLVETAITLLLATLIIGASLRAAFSPETGSEIVRSNLRLRGEVVSERIVKELEFAALDLPTNNGTTLAWQTAVDPDGDGSLLGADGLPQWGGRVGGVATAGVRTTVRWVMERTVDEAALGSDINADGDQLDAFDLGRIERVEPDGTTAPLLGAWVVQRNGAWGGDLDGDGTADPLFTVDDTGALRRVRLDLVLAVPTGGGSWVLQRTRREVVCVNDRS